MGLPIFPLITACASFVAGTSAFSAPYLSRSQYSYRRPLRAARLPAGAGQNEAQPSEMQARVEKLSLSQIRELYRKLGGGESNQSRVQLLKEVMPLLEERLSGQSLPLPVVEASPPKKAAVPVSTRSPRQVKGPPHNNFVKRIVNEEGKVWQAAVRTAKKSKHDSWLTQVCVNPDKNKAKEHPMLRDREARLKRMPESDMSLTFLGTASCMPGESRFVSCIALRLGGESWLFDAGEGSQIRMQKSSVKPTRVTKIFVTHVHGDHTFGLPGLLCLLGQDGANNPYGQRSKPTDGRPNGPVEIYGPKGTRMLIRSSLRLSYSKITVDYVVHELIDVPYLHGNYMPPPIPPKIELERDALYGEKEGGKDLYPNADGVFELFSNEQYTAYAAPMKHTIPCVGYMVKEATQPGHIEPAMIQDIVYRNAQAIKEKYEFRDARMIFRLIKNEYKEGGVFTFPGDGTTVKYDDIMEPERPGRKVVILGDTCDAGAMAHLAQGADIVIHEATNTHLSPFDDPKTYATVEREARIHGHSTPHMAANFAEYVGAKQLILTHFSPRYKGETDPVSLAVMRRIELQAQTVHGWPYHRVIAAWDLMSMPVLRCNQWPAYHELEMEHERNLEEESLEFERQCSARLKEAQDSKGASAGTPAATSSTASTVVLEDTEDEDDDDDDDDENGTEDAALARRYFGVA